MRGRGGDGILNNFCFSQIGGIWRGGEGSFVKFIKLAKLSLIYFRIPVLLLLQY
jgi:hypothetical protein